MSYNFSAVDYTTLPTALLPVLKDQVRVVGNDEDAMMTRHLKWSIGYRQDFVSQQIFGGTVLWTPDTSESRAQCPVQPVSAFVVMSATVDVSADYELETASPISPVWLVRIDGTAFHEDAEVTLTVGFAAADDLPPVEECNILRVAAMLYEHRESVTSLDLEQMPLWLNDALGGLWMPRA